MERATPATTDDNLLPFAFPAVERKKVTAAFDGGRLSSDGGVMLLSQAERRLGLAERLAAVIPDERDASRVIHRLPDILRARIFAIACGYEDGDDLDRLRSDPTFKLACGRLPDTGTDLCSQPTVSRWENAPSLRDLIRLMRVMVDLYCASYRVPPAAVTLDIDDTVDVVHGHQQLSFFNAHYDERCFLPIHIYDTSTARPVAVLLRPGKTPSGKELRGHLRRLVQRIRKHWPQTHITIRGDGHYRSDNTARIWDAATAKEIAVLRGHQWGVSSAAFSPDGSRIVTASLDQTARIWDTATAKQIAVLSGHENFVLSAAFNSDGSCIVTASRDRTARIWDAATAKETVVLRGHEGYVSSAAFSPDGSRIVTASNDKTARVWDVATAKLSGVVCSPKP